MATRETQQTSPVMHGPITLDTVSDPRYRVVEPFDVEWYEELGAVVAWIEETQECGDGATLDAALADLQVAMIETYEILAEDPANLGAGLSPIYEAYRRKLVTSSPTGA